MLCVWVGVAGRPAPKGGWEGEQKEGVLSDRANGKNGRVEKGQMILRHLGGPVSSLQSIQCNNQQHYFNCVLDLWTVGQHSLRYVPKTALASA